MFISMLGSLVQDLLDLQLWVAYAPCGAQHKDAVQVTLEQIDLIKRFIEAYPKHLQLVKSSQGNSLDNKELHCYSTLMYKSLLYSARTT